MKHPIFDDSEYMEKIRRNTLLCKKFLSFNFDIWKAKTSKEIPKKSSIAVFDRFQMFQTFQSKNNWSENFFEMMHVNLIFSVLFKSNPTQDFLSEKVDLTQKSPKFKLMVKFKATIHSIHRFFRFLKCRIKSNAAINKKKNFFYLLYFTLH